ncbi:hypothetical protein IU485_16060 [Nocardia cyriacigeorgica]|uniref:hypothetical protein n=1 Tax=Nocardia cyriacigeorgica TaxID=135487 RepID=UPI00189306FD|nr:hypothetical protein [Nocardia cyriacigeorgica]MBF6082880.1 hypothetical protein [Nocardia cyriacigeorgica]
MSAQEPILDVAGGDPAVSRQLSDALRAIAANTTDPAVKDQISAVLEGKLAVRDFVRAEAFNQTLDRVMPAALEEFESMPEDQRQRLAEQGEAELERYRAELREPTPPAEPMNHSQRPQSPGPPEAASTTTTTGAGAGQLIPGTRKPNRDVIVTPDEPDEDDLYFQERRQRGWLE